MYQQHHAKYELGMSQNMVEQIIRPTGLVDPEIIIKPVVGQVDHLLGEIKRKIKDKSKNSGNNTNQKDGRRPNRLLCKGWNQGKVPTFRYNNT